MRFLFLIFFLFNCEENFETHVSIYKNHKASNLENYTSPKSYENRVYNLDELRKDLILKINHLDGFSNIPKEAKNFEEFKIHLSNISKTLPKEIKILFDRYIFGIYLCENLGGTGLTHFISKKEKVYGGIIFLDISVLNQSANEWISYKENTVFLKKELDLEIEIESEKENTVENAIKYILLHEFGHILATISEISPNIFISNPEIKSDFYRGIWLKDKILRDPKTNYNFPEKIKFYSNKKIYLEDNWKNIYPPLFDSPFSTLYGATNAGDHFAESFVSYVHVILEKKPWTLKIKNKNKIIYSMENLILKNQFEQEYLKKLIEDKSK